MIYLVAIKVLLILGAAHSSRVHCTPHFCCHFGESSSRDAVQLLLNVILL